MHRPKHVIEAERIQRDRFKAMTPNERWKAAHQLYWSARRLKTAYIRGKHPDWSSSQVDEAVKKAFQYARD